MYELLITIDTNDADYLTRVTQFSEQQYKDFDKFIPLLTAIKENNGQLVFNYGNEYRKKDKNISFYTELLHLEYIIDDDDDDDASNYLENYPLIDEFFNFLPSFDYGFHTITECNLRELEVISEINFV